jgi:hypothetical protein
MWFVYSWTRLDPGQCILSAETILTWNDSPVDSISTSTNWKYWSMDHRDSTAPSAYDTKKLSAAGVRIS